MPDSANSDHDIAGRMWPGGKAGRLAGWLGVDRLPFSVVHEMDMRVGVQLGNPSYNSPMHN